MPAPLHDPPAAPTLTLSTAKLPARSHLPSLRDYLVELMRVEVETPAPGGAIDYQATLRVLPGASWGRARASALLTTRSASLLRDGKNDLMLVMPGAPMTVRGPGSDELQIAPGDALLLSQARQTRILHTGGPSWALQVPQRDIERLVPGIGAAPLMALRRGTPMLTPLRRYGLLLEAQPLGDPVEQQAVSRQLHDMLAVAIGASADYRAHLEAGPLTAVRLATLRSDIDAQLGDPQLRLDTLAARQGVTPRHLQRLLARQGLDFSTLLRQARLQRARTLLEDPRQRGRTILSIALECGFSEASALNRAFRQAYGLRPGDLR